MQTAWDAGCCGDCVVWIFVVCRLYDVLTAWCTERYADWCADCMVYRKVCRLVCRLYSVQTAWCTERYADWCTDCMVCRKVCRLVCRLYSVQTAWCAESYAV